MGITMPTVKLTEKEWNNIYIQIKEEYKDQPSVFMIRGCMRDVLGFTQRTYRYWKPDDGHGVYDGHGDYVTEMHLDFYSESAETMFRLKYL